MANGRYSTFKESSTRSSWTTGEMVQRLTSNWLLECCCGSCYAKQKAVSLSKSNGTNEMDGKKNLEPIIESEIPPIDSAKSKDVGELTTEEIPLTKRDYGVSKDDEFLTSSVNKERVLLTSRKNDSSINISGESESKSPFGSGMKRAIGSLPVLSKKEKKSPSVNEGKKASQSDSELGYPPNIFAKCSKRYGEQKVSTMNIPKLIIS